MTRPDDSTRELAVRTVDRNVVVLAGAGSGKTSLLVERMLHLVLDHDRSLPSLAAITFTEAAAAEMRERLGGALTAVGFPDRSGASAPALPGAEAERGVARSSACGTDGPQRQERARLALRDLTSSTITTIHGFAHGLLRRHPVEAGIAPAPAVREPGEIRRHLAAMWPAVLEEIAADAASGLHELLVRFSLSDLAALWEGLAASVVPIPERWETGAVPAGRLLAPLWSDVERRAAAAGPAGAKRIAPLLPVVRMALRQGTVELAALDAVRGRKGPASAGTEGLDPDLERVRALLGAMAVDRDAPFRDALRLLAPAARRARAEIHRRGWLSFDALLWQARELLRRDVRLRREEGARCQVLLLDEFQDTDPLQYEIVFLLAEDPAGPPSPDAWSSRLAPGRLFVVGDPKQSIFRFRGADIDACERAVERLSSQGALTLSLTSSHRSPQAVLAPLHDLFSGWLGPRTPEERNRRAAPAYAPVVASRPAPDPAHGGTPRVEVWTVAGEGAAARRSREAGAIAHDIVERHKGGVPLAHHAVLLRSFSDVAVYVRALSDRRVPCVVDGGRTFYRRPEVRDLLALVACVAEPNDAVALLAVLRSSVGAVPDRELLAHAVRAANAAAPPTAQGPWDPGALVDAAATPRLAEVLAWLAALRARAAHRPAGEALSGILDASRLEIIHATAPDGAQRVANLRQLVALAAEGARREGWSLAELALQMAARGGPDGEEEGEPALGADGSDAVSVLTIHRAKGREFPVVYLADLARGAPEERRDAELTILDGPGIRGVSARSGRTGLRTTVACLARELALLHEPAEARRLLYVAATRARERLVLVAAAEPSPWVRALGAWGYDPTMPPPDGALLAASAVKHRSLQTDAPVEPLSSGMAADLGEAVRRFEAMTAAISRLPPFLSPTARAERLAREPHALAGVERMHAFAVGSAVHAVLERAELGAPGLREAANLEAIATEMCRERPGAEPARVLEAAGRLLRALDGTALWARLGRVRVLARELPLLAISGERQGPLASEAMSGYADLVFEEDGVLVVADWKTDPVVEPAAIASLLERYRPQVMWYAEALAAAQRRPVRAEILLVAPGLAVVVGEAAPAVGKSS